MDRPKDGTLSYLNVFMLVAIAIAFAAAPSAFAKHPPANSTDKPATVIAHVALPGNPGTQMLLQQRSDHEYLYIVRNSKKGFTVVDVTNPSRPDVLERVSWPQGASLGQLQLVGNRLGIAEGTEGTSANAAPLRTETVELLDLSDPANPKTIQTFEGVTSILPDPGRHLVYLTNGEGLWVVRQNRNVQIPACTTGDGISDMPLCN
jgi:LVIVD repeat-containing protein